MSIVSLATGDPTCTTEDLHAIAEASNFDIEPNSANEKAFLLFQNSFDAVCQNISDLPEYVDPRLVPTEVEAGQRKYYRPTTAENPLNAWSHRTNLVSSKEACKHGRLAGKTFAVKDNVSVAGLPLTVGASPDLFRGGKHPISTIDAVVVRRILEAGGTIKGTSTCENFSLFALSYTSDGGVVHNAWMPGYATGGSSSGSGCLVSIGDVKNAREEGRDGRDYPLGEGVDLAVGGDQGGSIRLPAAYSGIFGLKPTHGLVPYTGIVGLSPMIDHTGPMARTVEDTALMLGVLAGYDGIDPRMSPETPLPSQVPDYVSALNKWVESKQAAGEWTPTTAAKGLRIGIIKEAFTLPGISPEVDSTVRTAASRFTSLGASVREISIPFHLQGPSIWTVATRSMIKRFLANEPADSLSHPLPGLDPLPFDQNFYTTVANRNPAVVNVLLNAAHLDRHHGPAIIRKAHMHAFQLRAAYDEALQDLDVLVTPVNPTVGPKLPPQSARTDINPHGRSERLADLTEPAIGNTGNTAGFNVSGHPAMSMPVGWGKVEGGEGRLPVGMQLVAKRWDEASIFKAAKAWEVGGRWSDS